MGPWEAAATLSSVSASHPVTAEARPASSAWPHRLYRQALAFAFLLGGDPRRASSSCRHPLQGRLADEHALLPQTAARAFLLGSNVRVENLVNGRSCTNEALRIKLSEGACWC